MSDELLMSVSTHGCQQAAQHVHTQTISECVHLHAHAGLPNVLLELAAATTTAVTPQGMRTLVRPAILYTAL